MVVAGLSPPFRCLSSCTSVAIVDGDITSFFGGQEWLQQKSPLPTTGPCEWKANSRSSIRKGSRSALLDAPGSVSAAAGIPPTSLSTTGPIRPLASTTKSTPPIFPHLPPTHHFTDRLEP